MGLSNASNLGSVGLGSSDDDQVLLVPCQPRQVVQVVLLVSNLQRDSIEADWNELVARHDHDHGD